MEQSSLLIPLWCQAFSKNVPLHLWAAPKSLAANTSRPGKRLFLAFKHPVGGTGDLYFLSQLSSPPTNLSPPFALRSKWWMCEWEAERQVAVFKKKKSLNLLQLSALTHLLRSKHINKLKRTNRCLTLANSTAYCGWKNLLLLVGNSNLI